jgi:hypothetical protein
MTFASVAEIAQVATVFLLQIPESCSLTETQVANMYGE